MDKEEDRVNYFPAILIQKSKKTVKGVAALKLESILKGELLVNNSQMRDSNISALNKMHPGRLQNNREAFILAISGLDDALSLELYISAFPSLVHPSENRLEIVLFICGQGTSGSEIKEKIISAFLNITPLLGALFSEADFSPVSNVNTLKKMRANTHFKHALSIERKVAEVELKSPFSGHQIGFGAKADTNEKQTDSETQSVRHLFQWTPSLSDWSQLINVMLNQLDPNRIIVRIKNARQAESSMENLKKTIRNCDQFLGAAGHENITQKEQTLHIKKQTLSRLEGLIDSSFNVGVFLLTANMSNMSLAKVLGGSITTVANKKEAVTVWENGFRISKTSVRKAVNTACFPDADEPFTAAEVACAFRLPSPPFDEIPPGFPVKRFRTALSMITDSDKDSQGILLAHNVHQGTEKPVMLDIESRLRHCFILGQTGTGKSTLMSNMILQDIQAGRGVAVIDPHGDMIDDILGRIPEHRVDDVILFDPLDTERPIAFNMLEWSTIQERDLIIDELLQIIHQIYDLKNTGGPMFEYYFRGALALLMGDKKRPDFEPTLLDFMKFFIDENFRKYLANTVDDVHLQDFLNQARKVSGDASMQNIAPYITSKLARLQDVTLKRILGQSRSSFKFEEILDEGKIFLVKLGKGRFGKDTAGLLANMIVSRLKLAAMKRGEIKPHLRRDFFFYIDEAHNLPAENFMQLLSEARKYHVGLVLATQYAAQLTRSSVDSRDNLLSALMGNVGQTITFRLGQEDANTLAPSFEPVFGNQDIIALPNWHAYVRMQQQDNAAAPFSIKTAINNTPFNLDIAKKIKILSSLKYGMDSRLVDEGILARRSEWKSSVR